MEKWEHKKTGKIYTVTGIGVNCSNKNDGEIIVIYERCGITYVREEKEFHEKFEKVEE